MLWFDKGIKEGCRLTKSRVEKVIKEGFLEVILDMRTKTHVANS